MLIVEDSDLVVKKLSRLLEPIPGLKIDGRASDGYSAVRMIKEYLPDFVILDISLKQGHGIQVLEEVQKMSYKPYIIVLTNLNFRYYRDKCRKLGAKHFFDKTMEFEKVYDVLYEKTTGKQNEHEK
jgi:DNA-binding NarL/FixJ family response regulator